MRSDRSDFYQWALIFSIVVVTGLLGVFVYRELFPEYKEYQNRYVALEEFRSSYTGQPVAPFKSAIKQIVLTPEDGGPETIDRCVSCHVALKLSHFSPSKLAADINGAVIRDSEGVPVQVPNEDYVWDRLEQEIAELTDPAVLAQLEEQGESSELARRKAAAEDLEKLKTVHTHEGDLDAKAVLQMHPLLGRETRPFEYHSVEEFGCSSCHGGNGRGLVTDRAHGPVYDGQYHIEYEGPRPTFIESDESNDPKFAKVFNSKPGHRLLFQTKPLLTGALMQAKCMQCHKTRQGQLQGIVDAVGIVVNRKEKQIAAVEAGVESDKAALLSLIGLINKVNEVGVQGAIDELNAQLQDFRLSADELDATHARLSFLEGLKGQDRGDVVATLTDDMRRILGGRALVGEALSRLKGVTDTGHSLLSEFIEDYQGRPDADGSLFAKIKSSKNLEFAVDRVEQAKSPLANLASDNKAAQVLASEAGQLLSDYERGEKLFFSQACYACHKIAGLTRGGVGPELTEIGLAYPWYVKESIVWPQSNLKTSTMPNFKLDHEEVEHLMTFLMAQRGSKQSVSAVDAAVSLRAFEEGQLASWEEPLAPSKVTDVHASQLVFATQGCAACHRLKGFESNVGYSIEKGSPSDEELAQERRWFKSLFPIDVMGSQIVTALEEHGDELRRRLSDDVRENSIVEEIDEVVPNGVEAFYTAFKFAGRAKDAEIDAKRKAATSAAERAYYDRELEDWQELVSLAMKQYIREFGLGRDIGPRLHWSGVYRDSEWLVEHFRNPGSHVAKSIMPVLPFDDSKFYALTYMLQELGQRNRDEQRKEWAAGGFDAEKAFQVHCSVCHGDYLRGNGPIAQWIYPVPKNLRNATFLRNLSRERAIASIVHGVKGTPMPPWGEAPEDTLFGTANGGPVLTQQEIEQLVDWLFQGLPGARVIESDVDVEKWQYGPDDFLEELETPPVPLQTEAPGDSSTQANTDVNALPPADQIYVDLHPRVYIAQAGAARAGNHPTVEDIFEVRPAVKDGPGSEKQSYYIRDEFYTEDNLAAGRQLFLTNCAHCHGREGGGNGERAGTMVDAKPRMLTNLPWLRTRDDLRLLRSLKYGVPGTSMTPWGDKTNALQRMQIVMFIRSLTADRRLRDDISSMLYQVFERAEQTVTSARAVEYEALSKAEAMRDQVSDQREELQLAAQRGEASPSQVARLYERELELANQVQERREIDEQLELMAEQLAAEREIYQKMGRAFIERDVPHMVIDAFYKMLKANQQRYSVVNGQLIMEDDKSLAQKLASLRDDILMVFDRESERLKAERARILSELPSAKRDEELAEVSQQLQGLQQLKRTLVSSLEQASKKRAAQRNLYAGLRSKMKSL